MSAKTDRRKGEAKKKAPIDYLDSRTGESTPVWILAVQRAIKDASTPPRTRGKYKGHSSTKVLKWIYSIAGQVMTRARIAQRKDRDENMGMAATLGMILCVWYVRIHRAKAMDPRRPIKLRRAALLQANEYVAELARVLHDDTWDPLVFPTQEWENPWHPKARDGKFV